MATSVISQDLASLHDGLAGKVAEAAESLQVPGVAVGIYRDGAEDYVFHGVTSVDNPLEVNEKTLFQIGSTGKTYTATALMRLAEQERVGLDNRVREYVPELELGDQDAAARVTVHQLLNHTAGWQGDIFDNVGDGEDCLARYVEHMATLDQVSPLGSTFSYNNAAVALAGRVIEKVTGRVFEDAIKELVLAPLGLDHSHYYLNDVMTERFAVGHLNREDVLEVAHPWHMPRCVNPMGGLASTAADQVRYARFHLGDGRAHDGSEVLRRASLDLMKVPTVQIPSGVPADAVGLSWLIRDIEDTRMVGHGGATVGQLSAFQMIPAKDFAFTILTNSSPKGGELLKEISRWVLETYVGVIEPADAEPLSLTSDQLQEYAGDYATEASTITVRVDGDHLVAKSEVDPAEWAKISNDPPVESPPLNVKLLADDLAIVVDGPSKGAKFLFVRESGKITGVNLGRLAKKRGD